MTDLRRRLTALENGTTRVVTGERMKIDVTTDPAWVERFRQCYLERVVEHRRRDQPNASHSAATELAVRKAYVAIIYDGISDLK